MRAIDTNTVVYPDHDGEPMADNTLHYEWITVLEQNLDAELPDFVAGDSLWYPVQGEVAIRRAPDVLVALGRPKGHRGSYRQWEEGDVPPQLVVEVRSLKNTGPHLASKLAFYRRYGSREVLVLDPDRHRLDVWSEGEAAFRRIPPGETYVSTVLGIRFCATAPIQVTFADGRPFETFADLLRSRGEARQRAEHAKRQADEMKKRADDAEQRAVDAEARLAELEARLEALERKPD